MKTKITAIFVFAAIVAVSALVVNSNAVETQDTKIALDEVNPTGSCPFGNEPGTYAGECPYGGGCTAEKNCGNPTCGAQKTGGCGCSK